MEVTPYRKLLYMLQNHLKQVSLSHMSLLFCQSFTTVEEKVYYCELQR